jgi:hypothetical protein
MSVYMVSNGTVGDKNIMTMGYSHNMVKRLPSRDLPGDVVPPSLDDNYAAFADDLDWFVWEPVDSAHVVGALSRRPIDDARLDTIAVPAGMPSALRVPFGRYGEAHKVVRINPPCTTRDLLTLIRSVYAKPATATDIEAVRIAKGVDGGNRDDDYTRAAVESLADGRSVQLVDLGGYSYYAPYELEQGPIINELTGLARPEATLNWPTRRHPLGDCMGMVRFEGLSKGKGSWLDVLVGS